MIDSDMWAAAYIAAIAAGTPPDEAVKVADYLMDSLAIRFPEHEVTH